MAYDWACECSAGQSACRRPSMTPGALSAGMRAESGAEERRDLLRVGLRD